jgi:hypothetical protein
MPRFTLRKVIPIGATARVVVAQGAPETLTLVRHRTQSTAETIARLSVTAVLPTWSRPVTSRTGRAS